MVVQEPDSHIWCPSPHEEPGTSVVLFTACASLRLVDSMFSQSGKILSHDASQSLELCELHPVGCRAPLNVEDEWVASAGQIQHW